jgi:hypothetical protein
MDIDGPWRQLAGDVLQVSSISLQITFEWIDE